MKKIVVIIPKEGQDWRATLFRGGSIKRKSALSLLTRIERTLGRSRRSANVLKFAVKVNYGKGYVNESYPSADSKQQLYALTCFLEDYLPENSLDSRYKKY